MRRRFGIITVIGALVAGALLGVVVASPLLASADSPTPTSTGKTATKPSGPMDRLTAIKNALKGLVSDGTITQSQADKVAATLDKALPQGRFGRFGPRFGLGPPGLLQDKLDAAAKALGMTPDQVKAALRNGTSLAALAKQKGVAESTLVNALVTQVTNDIDQAVKDGKLSAAMATRLKTNLQARITRLVESTPPAMGHGWRGMMPPNAPPNAPPKAPPGTPAPSGTA